MKGKLTTGTVKFFNRRRGFGFIVRDDGGRDVYVNIVDVQGRTPLNEGDKVQFDIVEEERGPRAKNVVLVE